MGSAAGAVKTAARRLGMTVEEYGEQLRLGRKWCRSCRSWLDRDSFGRDSSRGDGLAAVCSPCGVTSADRPGARERRLRAVEGLAWCRGCRTWLPASDVRSGVCRPHANEEARRAYAADGAAIRASKYARRRGLAPIPEWWWTDALSDWGGLCAYGCGHAGVQREHVQPVARGGRSTPGNVVPACATCNASKKASAPATWVERGFAALPAQWTDLAALAIEQGTDEWLGTLLDGVVHDGHPA